MKRISKKEKKEVSDLTAFSERRMGVAIPIVIGIIAVLFTAAFMIHNLLRGVGIQREYSDAHIRALAIAESGYQFLAAKIMAKPWEMRWFANNPDSQSNFPHDGGKFSYYIEDTAGISESADIWVRGEYKNAKRLIFYRARYEDFLFKGLTSPTPDYTTSVDEKPHIFNPSDVSPMTDQVNKLIEKRKKNLLESKKPWEDKFSEILASLGALQITKPPLITKSKAQDNLDGIDGGSRQSIYDILNDISDMENTTALNHVATGTSPISYYVKNWVDGKLSKIEALLNEKKIVDANDRYRKLVKSLHVIAKMISDYLMRYSSYYYSDSNNYGNTPPTTIGSSTPNSSSTVKLSSPVNGFPTTSTSSNVPNSRPFGYGYRYGYDYTSNSNSDDYEDDFKQFLTFLESTMYSSYSD
ncbi:MAG: hypothetical protein HQM08_08115 [Candidatus Riflebacteria bacterium]|nr:hypothetical protein [Candidatus Riflebacteria bacterium]